MSVDASVRRCIGTADLMAQRVEAFGRALWVIAANTLLSLVPHGRLSDKRSKDLRAAVLSDTRGSVRFQAP